MISLRSLQESDSEVYDIINYELNREHNTLQLIASENFVSKAVLEAQGSIFTNKYAEGYYGKRFYAGCAEADKVEQLAIDRICKIFDCKYANVQPHSGSQANQAVFLALLQPKDTILGFSLAAGGHLTHGAPPNLSGKWFNAVHYGVSPETLLIDMEEVRALAQKHNPKLIICGASAYTRHIDFKQFKEIADEVGAYLLADMAHYAGLIAGGVYPSPFPYADFVTATTHKTLRGPRGAIILTNQEELNKKINLAVFPGLQGGPQMHSIAAKAVAFQEILQPSFKEYAQQVLKNARVLSETLKNQGYTIITGGTDCHAVLVDLRAQNLKGNIAANLLEKAGIICNKNALPFDQENPFITSGIRVGTPAETTRGLKEEDFIEVGNMIGAVLAGKDVEQVKMQVSALCERFPFYTSIN